MHLYLQAEIDEVDYITTGVESSPIITAVVESKVGGAQFYLFKYLQ